MFFFFNLFFQTNWTTTIATSDDNKTELIDFLFLYPIIIWVREFYHTNGSVNYWRFWSTQIGFHLVCWFVCRHHSFKRIRVHRVWFSYIFMIKTRASHLKPLFSSEFISISIFLLSSSVSIWIANAFPNVDNYQLRQWPKRIVNASKTDGMKRKKLM